jgi:hypothetical protein
VWLRWCGRARRERGAHGAVDGRVDAHGAVRFDEPGASQQREDALVGAGDGHDVGAARSEPVDEVANAVDR